MHGVSQVSLAHGQLKPHFSSQRHGLFGSTSTAWALGVELKLFPVHSGAERLCALACVSAASGVYRRAVFACRVVVVARAVCAKIGDPVGCKRTVSRVCSHCACLSASSCGLKVAVRRESACAAPSTVTNAARHVHAGPALHVSDRKFGC